MRPHISSFIHPPTHNPTDRSPLSCCCYPIYVLGICTPVLSCRLFCNFTQIVHTCAIRYALSQQSPSIRNLFGNLICHPVLQSVMDMQPLHLSKSANFGSLSLRLYFLSPTTNIAGWMDVCHKTIVASGENRYIAPDLVVTNRVSYLSIHGVGIAFSSFQRPGGARSGGRRVRGYGRAPSRPGRHRRRPQCPAVLITHRFVTGCGGWYTGSKWKSMNTQGFRRHFSSTHCFFLFFDVPFFRFLWTTHSPQFQANPHFLRVSICVVFIWSALPPSHPDSSTLCSRALLRRG